MEKYNLTDRLLQKVFNRLVDAKVISWSEIQERVRPYEDSEHLQTVTVRILPREKVDFPLPVYEADHPEIRGFVKDITEKGLGIKGIEARVDQVKTLVIPADELFQVSPLHVTARCRWAQIQPDGHYVGGFEISKVTAGDLTELCKLIQSLTLADRSLLEREY
jgi:hypothetical protein